MTKITIFNLLLMMISTVGTWEWLRRRTKIDVYFLPSLAISVQVSCLFIAGILNFLFETAIALYILGITTFFYYLLKKDSRSFLSGYLKVGFVFLLLASLVMLAAVRGKHFGHIDNFTHWATVVKEMLKNNRFPNFSDKVIGFPAYPLGSSSFIYYFSRMTGTSESMQMFAQIYMMLTCILPLFIFCKNNKTTVFLLVCSLTNFFFVYNITVTNLLVDTLLPLTAMCGFLFVIFHGKDINIKPIFMACVFYMIWIVQIKNSGAFFVFLMIIGLFFVKGKQGSIYLLLLCSALPFLSLLIWQKHFMYVFENAEKSKHAMTVTNFSGVFLSKTQSDIQSIIDHIFQFLSSWKDIRLTVLMILLTGLIVFITKGNRKDYIRMVLISVVLFTVYQVGLFAMYSFSMSGEGLYFIVTERYDKSIMIAIVYLIMAMVIKVISKEETSQFIGAISTLMMIIFIFGFMKISQGEIRIAGKHYDVPPWYLEKRLWIDKHKTDFIMEEDDTYCILTKDEVDNNYMHKAGRYIFFTDKVETKVVTDMTMMDDVTEEFIFIYDEDNEIIQEWVRNHYPEQVGNSVVRRWDLYPSVNN